MRRGSSNVEVTWHMVARPRADYGSVPDHWIGKWLVCCGGLDGFLPKTYALCVVDDFGDLVPVPMGSDA